MARRLILDTGVVIAWERGLLDRRRTFRDDDDAVIAAVSVAELRAGIELRPEADAARRTSALIDILRVLPVESYDSGVAEVHARLIAHARRSGRPRGAHDLIIAATAAATGRRLLTTAARAGFEDLPGVDVRLLPVRKES